MRTCTRTLTTLIVAAAATAAVVATASAAGPRRDRSGYVYVTAESRYSMATITAPVRMGPRGRLEVRLPGGTWLECERSCGQTLRINTIDFWAVRGFGKGGDDGPGYLTFRR